jgi:hypothetical protein
MPGISPQGAVRKFHCFRRIRARGRRERGVPSHAPVFDMFKGIYQIGKGHTRKKRTAAEAGLTSPAQPADQDCRRRSCPDQHGKRPSFVPFCEAPPSGKFPGFDFSVCERQRRRLCGFLILPCRANFVILKSWRKYAEISAGWPASNPSHAAWPLPSRFINGGRREPRA